jgi:Cytochrome c554 and c-prime
LRTITRNLLSAIGLLGFAAVASFSPAAAQSYFVGPQKCAECHKAEQAIWEKTKHATSFREIHRKEKVKDIIAAAGGDSNMRRNAVCTACHFTSTKADAGAQATATAGPSCESCHGPASDWLTAHSDYGGPAAKRETETPARKTERLKKAADAGMIGPTRHFDIAKNCLSCHGFGRPGVEPAVIAKMIDAGHPPGSEFELVRYSQGAVRHRFYPPNVNDNAVMTPAELSRLFVAGHAAALVQTAGAAGKAANPKFQDTLKKIDAAARSALDSIKGQTPEAAALLAQPTEANARKLVDAIAGKDLSTQVGAKLPAKDSYK